MKVSVVDWSKKKVGELEFGKDLSEERIKKHLLHQACVFELARRRKGTHFAKTRSEVRGGGIKPFKQKGTGRARQGSIRSPLLEGGGVIFPPRPRDYSFKISKKQKRQALQAALSYLQKEKRLFFVKSIETEGKTKDIKQKVDKLGLKKVLLVDGKRDEKVERACRNLSHVAYKQASSVCVYDLLKYDAAICTESSIKTLEKRCG